MSSTATTTEHANGHAATIAATQSKRPPVPKFDKRIAEKFLRFAMRRSIMERGCVEIRIVGGWEERGYIVPARKGRSTFAGWYNNSNDVLVDLGKLRGIHGYCTINPVHRDLLSRCRNKLKRSNSATSNEDIVEYQTLYIDVDSRRRKDISATDAELAATAATRDQILGDHPMLAESAIWGKSGNGSFIFVMLVGYPPAEGQELAGKALEWLAAEYNNDAIKIDVSTKSAAQPAVIPGLPKCKGENDPERPWRLSTLDSPDRDPEDMPRCDLRAWLELVGADQVSRKPTHKGGAGHAGSYQRGVNARRDRAIARFASKSLFQKGVGRV